MAECLCWALRAVWGEGEGPEESELACMLSAASEWLPGGHCCCGLAGGGGGGMGTAWAATALALPPGEACAALAAGDDSLQAPHACHT